MIPRFKPKLGWSEFCKLFRTNVGSVKSFEREFAKQFDAIDAVAFPYGRSAQWAFFKAIGIDGAEVIMPAYTCSVVAHAVTLSGNTPRFVDITLDDFNMDLSLVEEAINERTRAIIATHTFGYPQNLEQLDRLAKMGEERYGHKIWVMQDCCHSFKAEWLGNVVGAAGDVAVYALNISKLMTSIFGGILTFQDQQLADKVRRFRDEVFTSGGIGKELRRRLYLIGVYLAFSTWLYSLTWWLQERTKFLNKFTKSYHLDEKIHFPPDHLEKMCDVEAAVGLIQLKRYSTIISERRANADWYDQNLARRPDWIFPKIVDGATYSHYVVLVPNRSVVLQDWAKKKVHLGELIQYSIPSLSCYREEQTTTYPRSVLASKMAINFPISGVDVRRVTSLDKMS